MIRWLVNSWYQSHPIRWLLWPLSLLYRAIISLRRYGYHLGLLAQTQLDVPVIIVGNISVGGTGKTPLVIYLAQQLKQAGYTPGIISRGYGGHSDHYPLNVTSQSLASQVGDEPVIIHRRSACPMVVGADRVAAAKHLLAQHHCDIIISDDGLQHYALARTIEIAVVDASRRFGNRLCLPAGPLREPMSRLKDIDFIVYNGQYNQADYIMSFNQQAAINLVDPNQTKALSEFKGQAIHAIAGIGHPQRFFDQLRHYDLHINAHAFDDHHPYIESDVNFSDDNPILMTEKDAVKCQNFANENMWYIPIEAQIHGKLVATLLNTLAERIPHG